MCGHLVFHCAHVSAAVYPCAVSTHRLRTLDEGGELPSTGRRDARMCVRRCLYASLLILRHADLAPLDGEENKIVDNDVLLP
jgi:hypothetical protein